MLQTWVFPTNCKGEGHNGIKNNQINPDLFEGQKLYLI